MALCSQIAWTQVNGKYKNWYLENYQWLEQFPPEMSDLRDFYIFDMKSRNLQPLDSFKNCYEFLFSYALENMPRVGKEGRFTGQTFFQRLVKDQWRNESILWSTIKTTVNQFTDIASWIVPLGIAFLVIYAVKK